MPRWLDNFLAVCLATVFVIAGVIFLYGTQTVCRWYYDTKIWLERWEGLLFR